MEEPRPCTECGEIFTPRQKGRPNLFCSRPCYWQAARKATKKPGVERRMVSRPEHPIAPASGVIALARVVLYDKIGPGGHPCNWCEKQVRWDAERYAADALIADHLNHDPSDDRPENLVATCNACNAHRRKNGGAPRIQEGEKTVVRGGKDTRAVELFCQICGDLFLINPAGMKRGRGRTCSLSCARQLPKGIN